MANLVFVTFKKTWGVGMGEFCKHDTHESHYCGSCNKDIIDALKAEIENSNKFAQDQADKIVALESDLTRHKEMLREAQGFKEVVDLYTEEGKQLIECTECERQVPKNMCKSDHCDNGESAYWTHVCESCDLKSKLEIAREALGWYSKHKMRVCRTECGTGRAELLAEDTLKEIGGV